MVYLFVPNIIGYLRFVLLFAVFFTYKDHPILTILSYGISQTLDMVDGMAARKFNQCSSFGSVLDMTCDRASNGVLLAILGSFYPEISWLFYGDIVLDLVSHWYQMYAALSCNEHHKKIKNKFRLLDLYYGNKLVLGGLVAGNQIFLGGMYVYYFKDTLDLGELQVSILMGITAVAGILFLIKKLMSVLQLIGSADKIVQKDIKERKEQGIKDQ